MFRRTEKARFRLDLNSVRAFLTDPNSSGIIDLNTVAAELTVKESGFEKNPFAEEQVVNVGI